MSTKDLVAFVRRGYDALGFMQQLGVIPAMGQVREALWSTLHLGDKELGGERLPSSLFTLSTCFSSSV
jgi:hypothetical protein